jgi:hypothetical protein
MDPSLQDALYQLPYGDLDMADRGENLKVVGQERKTPSVFAMVRKSVNYVT